MFQKIIARVSAATKSRSTPTGPATFAKPDSTESANLNPTGSFNVAAEIGYCRLEPRQVLSATFSLAAGMLSLDGFDPGQDLTFSQGSVDIGGEAVDAYIFEIGGEDAWVTFDPANAGIELETPVRLEVASSLLTNGVSINGNSTIGITQASDFSIGNFSITNFSVTDQSIDLNINGHVTLSQLSLNDSDALDLNNPDLVVEATGTIDVTGNLINSGLNADSFISLTATGIASDITIDGAIVSTAAGNVSLAAADTISLLNSTTVSAGLSGNASLIANADDADGDTDSILISDASAINAMTGDIDLSAVGVDGGDITLGNVTTAGTVSIHATGNIIDGTADEIANVIGARADFSAASIGSLDDIDLDVQNLSFNSPGVVNIADLEAGLTVDFASSALSGSLTTNGPLTISADINLAGSFAFTVSDSATVGDNLTVNNNAIVTLTAATNETVDFIAGDDLIFDTGRVVTNGGGVHTVRLTADRESALDIDRGSITNTAGVMPTITTNTLAMTAAAGVGFVGNGLRSSVDTLTIENTVSGDVVICETDGVSLAGVSNPDRDISIAAGGFLNIIAPIDAGTGDVRLLANGDVLQLATGQITANELGVRQLANGITVADDVDGNGRFDVVLDADNDVDVLAALNGFEGGVIVYADRNQLQIGAVSDIEICDGITFATTTGITSATIIGAAQGAGDGDRGDILIRTAGSLLIEQQISAGGGLADVRLIANGDLHQSVNTDLGMGPLTNGLIFANELGVRQESNVLAAANDIDSDGGYDIILCFDNQVEFFAAENQFNGGGISFYSAIEFQISTVVSQTIANVTFNPTAGVISIGDQFLRSTGDLNIGTAINAGSGTIYLVANGDILQDPGVTITAAGLGVQQLATVYNAADDLNGNGLFDIILTANNAVNNFAAINRFEDPLDITGGLIAFRSINDLTIFSIPASDFCDFTFVATNGVRAEGDILIAGGGSLNLLASINADDGLNDVRLIANGDVFQNITSGITADLFAVRQERLVFDADHDLDGNVAHDVQLCGLNRVNVFAAINLAGDVDFNNGQALSIGNVDAQTIGNPLPIPVDFITFTATNGVTVGGNAVIQVAGDLQVDAAVTADESIFLLADGSLALNSPVTAPVVRLVAHDDIVQNATGVVTANQLGVRQESLLAGNIILDDGNDVNLFAAFNDFENGLVVFNDVDDLTIDRVAGITTDCGETFALTNGIDGRGDILIRANGALTINEEINADEGLNDVRLIASGNVGQLASGIVVADDLGVRQLAPLGDVVLCSENRVNTFASLNLGGDVQFHNAIDLTIGTVAAQTIGNITFDVTTGITSVGDQVFVYSQSALAILQPIIADSVRLISNGNITQDPTGTIFASQLGVRQQSSTGGRIALDDGNDVDTFAAFNNFDNGEIVFNDIDDLTIATVAAATLDCGAPFLATAGIDSRGDVLIRAEGPLNIEQEINADERANDVRLIANGQITQSATGIIVADELGVRQIGPTGDIVLCFENQVNTLAAFNPAGAVHFHSALDLNIGLVDAQTIGLITFDATTGISAGNDAIISSGRAIDITQSIVATDVRLIAHGAITQTTAGTILTNLLGVRQQSTTSGLDIVLDDGNDIAVLASYNASENGVLVFHNVDDLTVGTVGSVIYCGKTFATTSGIETTFAGPGGIGATDDNNGDVLISADGFLRIDRSIIAGVDSANPSVRGQADVRLIVAGSVTQAAAGFVLADELGVRQQNLVGVSDVILDANNDVKNLGVQNHSDGGVIVYNDNDEALTANRGLNLADVSRQTIGNVTYALTNGVSTTFSGIPVAGIDVAAGDVLINSNGFLQISGRLVAGTGNADIRLTANGDIEQTGGTVWANELGVRQRANSVSLVGDRDADGHHHIRLLQAGNDVDFLSLANQQTTSDLRFHDANNLTIDQVNSQTIGNVSFELARGVVSDNGLTLLANDGAGQLELIAEQRLDDGFNIPIITTGMGTFIGNSKIKLADNLGDRLLINGIANFRSNDSEIGQDGTAAGNGNVVLGSITANGVVPGTGKADITTDNPLVLAGNTSVDTLILTSSLDITNRANASIIANHAQFNAPRNVFIGNQSGDFLQAHTGVTEIEIGVVAANASIAANSSVQLNGNAPVATTEINQPHADPLAAIPNEFKLGTRVTQTLFVTSTGHIEQPDGVLNARRLGLDAQAQVHLNSVSTENIALAIRAGDSTVQGIQANGSLGFINTSQSQTTLAHLAGIHGSEVDPSLVQSILVSHQGQLQVDSVANPDSSLLATANLTGILTTASKHGSILLVANSSMALKQIVSAESNNSLPQVTTYVINGASNDANKISFEGGSIKTAGTKGTEFNFGVVNQSQVLARFGTDFNHNGVIEMDEYFAGTTRIIRLDGDTQVAPQSIQVNYGNPSETGYRVALVWDSQRRFYEAFGNNESNEVPNLYTTNRSTDSEKFFVDIFDQGPTALASKSITAASFMFQEGLNESMAPAGLDFNIDAIYAKVESWDRNAIVIRRDDLRVFTTVEVRNDQNINLFVGPNADNSLNSVSETLEAEFETASVASLPVAPSFSTNQVIFEPVFVERAQPLPYIPPFERPEYFRPDDPGAIRYVAVRIGEVSDVGYSAADYILEIDGELILKDPTADYEPLNEDQKFENVDYNKNQVAEIINQIEADPSAEAGLWYKIFVDYEDGSGKKDEVLFYHFKSGDLSSENLGPESDFADEPAAEIEADISPIEKETDGQPENDNELRDGELLETWESTRASETGAAFSANGVLVEAIPQTGIEKMGLSAGTIWLAALAAKQHRIPDSSTQQVLDPSDSELGFGRLERLKRRIAALSGR